MSDPCATRAPIPAGFTIENRPSILGWGVWEGSVMLSNGFKSENQARTWLDGFITGREFQK